MKYITHSSKLEILKWTTGPMLHRQSLSVLGFMWLFVLQFDVNWILWQIAYLFSIKIEILWEVTNDEKLTTVIKN